MAFRLAPRWRTALAGGSALLAVLGAAADDGNPGATAAAPTDPTAAMRAAAMAGGKLLEAPHAGAAAAAAAAAVAAGATATEATPAVSPPPGLHLEVLRAQMVGDGSMINVRFSVPGATRVPTDNRDTYLIDEATGQKFFVARLTRIGPAGPMRKSATGTSYLVFDNRNLEIKPGAQVTMMMGGLKQEHITLELP